MQLADSFAAGRAAETPLRIDANALRLRVQDFAWLAARAAWRRRVQARRTAIAAGSVD